MSEPKVARLTDRELATISELAVRYFLGWRAKPIGARRFPAFEASVRRALEERP